MPLGNLSDLIVRIRLEADDFRKGLSEASSNLSAAGLKMQKVGARLSLAVTAPLTGVGIASIKMAADAAESANKFNEVFDEAAGALDAFLAASQGAIPATRTELRGMAADVGGLILAFGGTKAEAVDLGQSFVTVAADLGSFHNALPTEALMAVRSALVGEAEPLRRFGVDTRQAALEAIALEHGLIRQGEALSDVTRAQAILIAIQTQQSDAMGDAARTAGSAANQMKFLSRDLKELGETIGAVLLPAVTALIENLRPWIERFKELDPNMQKVIVGVGILAAAVGPLLIAVGLLVTAIGAIGLPVAAAVAGIGALVAALILAWQNSETFRSTVIGAMEAVRDFIVPIIDEIRQAWAMWGDEILAVTGAVWGKIANVIQTQLDIIKAIVGGMLKIVGETIQLGLNLIQGDWKGAWKNIEKIIQAAQKIIIGIVKAMWDGIKREFGKGIDEAIDELEGFNRRAQEIVEKLSFGLVGGSIIPEMWAAINRVFAEGGDRALGTLTDFLNQSLGDVFDWGKTLRGIVGDAVDTIGGLFGVDGLAGKIRDFGSSLLAMAGPGGAIAAGVIAIGKLFGIDLIGMIEDALGKLGEVVRAGFKSITDSLRDKSILSSAGGVSFAEKLIVQNQLRGADIKEFQQALIDAGLSLEEREGMIVDLVARGMAEGVEGPEAWTKFFEDRLEEFERIPQIAGQFGVRESEAAVGFIEKLFQEGKSPADIIAIMTGLMAEFASSGLAMEEFFARETQRLEARKDATDMIREFGLANVEAAQAFVEAMIMAGKTQDEIWSELSELMQKATEAGLKTDEEMEAFFAGQTPPEHPPFRDRPHPTPTVPAGSLAPAFEVAPALTDIGVGFDAMRESLGAQLETIGAGTFGIREAIEAQAWMPHHFTAVSTFTIHNHLEIDGREFAQIMGEYQIAAAYTEQGLLMQNK